MASFFEQQAQARKMTTRLLILFTMAVVSIIASITLVTHFVLEMNAPRHRDTMSEYGNESRSLGPEVTVALLTLFVIGVGTLVRMAQIGGNGTNVALMLGGVPISPNSQEPGERRLLNVVEEMAIAASVPVPKVFMLQDESGINAFAAGTTPSQAVIGVTRGTVEALTRDELQGVVAHEFSHIFNGDMKLNLRLIGVLGGILALATIGRHMMRARGKDSGGIVAAGFVLFCLGYLGVFFGRLIKAAVSRQREFLADSSAVQYTRNPLGIGGALMKIRGAYSNVGSKYAEEASHMFFGTALNFSSLFATHPPLEQRIERISPALLKSGGWTARSSDAEADETEMNEMVSQLQSRGTQPARKSADVVASVGAPQARDLAGARALIHSLPESLRAELREVSNAREIMSALLLESGGGSEKQLALIRESLGDLSLVKVQNYWRSMNEDGMKNRLSILQLVLPAFRTLDDAQQRSFFVLARELVFADQNFDLFEYVALTIIEAQMTVKKKRAAAGKPTKSDVALVLSAVAYAGAPDIATSKRAFDQSLSAFDESLRRGLDFCPPDQCKFEHLSPAVWRLAHAQPTTKKSLVTACVQVILSDRTVTQEENELLHAVCAALEAPLPVMAAS